MVDNIAKINQKKSKKVLTLRLNFGILLNVIRKERMIKNVSNKKYWKIF